MDGTCENMCRENNTGCVVGSGGIRFIDTIIISRKEKERRRPMIEMVLF